MIHVDDQFGHITFVEKVTNFQPCVDKTEFLVQVWLYCSMFFSMLNVCICTVNVM